jgi:hypothetical protein
MKKLMGTHGPYDSLEGYAHFLKRVSSDKFKLDFVKWRKIDAGGKNLSR